MLTEKDRKSKSEEKNRTPKQRIVSRLPHRASLFFSTSFLVLCVVFHVLLYRARSLPLSSSNTFSMRLHVVCLCIAHFHFSIHRILYHCILVRFCSAAWSVCSIVPCNTESIIISTALLFCCISLFRTYVLWVFSVLFGC